MISLESNKFKNLTSEKGDEMFDHFECVKVELTDGIAWVRMNRPEKRNAMNPQLHDEMEEALTALEVDPDAKVIVVCGAGGNFSATLTCAGCANKTASVLPDLTFGDVWVCSGQSNMQLGVQNTIDRNQTIQGNGKART